VQWWKRAAPAALQQLAKQVCDNARACCNSLAHDTSTAPIEQANRESRHDLQCLRKIKAPRLDRVHPAPFLRNVVAPSRGQNVKCQKKNKRRVLLCLRPVALARGLGRRLGCTRCGQSANSACLTRQTNNPQPLNQREPGLAHAMHAAKQTDD
jgi:hypothetical protein